MQNVNELLRAAHLTMMVNSVFRSARGLADDIDEDVCVSSIVRIVVNTDARDCRKMDVWKLKGINPGKAEIFISGCSECSFYSGKIEGRAEAQYWTFHQSMYVLAS